MRNFVISITAVIFLALIGVAAAFSTPSQQAARDAACLRANGWTAIITGPGPDATTDWVMANPPRLNRHDGSYTYGVKFPTGQQFIGQGIYSELNASEIAIAQSCVAKAGTRARAERRAVPTHRRYKFARDLMRRQCILEDFGWVCPQPYPGR